MAKKTQRKSSVQQQRSQTEPRHEDASGSGRYAREEEVREEFNEAQRLASRVPPLAPDAEKRAEVTGGDVDADWQQADATEEVIGGSNPTPDQDVVDDIGRGAGVTYADDEPLRVEDKLVKRDEDRWELDPASAEDYPERIQEERKDGPPTRQRRRAS